MASFAAGESVWFERAKACWVEEKANCGVFYPRLRWGRAKRRFSRREGRRRRRKYIAVRFCLFVGYAGRVRDYRG